LTKREKRERERERENRVLPLLSIFHFLVLEILIFGDFFLEVCNPKKTKKRNRLGNKQVGVGRGEGEVLNMKSMWLHGCFSLQIGSSRISRNGLWRRGDLSSQISGQALLSPVLLQEIVDFSGGGGGGGDGNSRRSLDKAAKNPSCTAAVAATAFGQKNYSSSSFNSWNVDDHGSSSSWRRRRRRRRRRSKAFNSSPPPPPPNAPVQAEEEEEEEEAEDLDHNNPEANGSSIGNSLPQQTFSSTGRWNSLPPRYKLVLTTSLAFVICNMDKVIFQKPKTPKRKKEKKHSPTIF
jgi:hypothetical protein